MNSGEMVIANNLKPPPQTNNIAKHQGAQKTVTPETTTKFGIYGGQFIHEALAIVPRRVDHKLKPQVAKNKI